MSKRAELGSGENYLANRHTRSLIGKMVDRNDDGSHPRPEVVGQEDLSDQPALDLVRGMVEDQTELERQNSRADRRMNNANLGDLTAQERGRILRNKE